MVEDYKIHIRTHTGEMTGRYKVDRKGKRKPVIKYVEKYQTPVGTFLPGEWKTRALKAIREDGEAELLEKVKEHCREHCAWLRTEKDLEEYAIDCLCSRTYRHWPDFKYEETIIWM